jgi:hypothetical protein
MVCGAFEELAGFDECGLCFESHFSFQGFVAGYQRHGGIGRW